MLRTLTPPLSRGERETFPALSQGERVLILLDSARVRTSAKPPRATALRAKSKVQRTKTKEVRARRFALCPLLLARADRVLRKRDLGRLEGASIGRWAVSSESEG